MDYVIGVNQVTTATTVIKTAIDAFIDHVICMSVNKGVSKHIIKITVRVQVTALRVQETVNIVKAILSALFAKKDFIYINTLTVKFIAKHAHL